MGRIEDQLRLATFLRDGVIAVNHELAERMLVCGKAIAEDEVVYCVSDGSNAEDGCESDHYYSFEDVFESGSDGVAHEGEL
ncbi:MAG: hypothetical protein WBX38_12130 [Candidatus Sulfotelmatobacter sp.]